MGESLKNALLIFFDKGRINAESESQVTVARLGRIDSVVVIWSSRPRRRRHRRLRLPGAAVVARHRDEPEHGKVAHVLGGLRFVYAV